MTVRTPRASCTGSLDAVTSSEGPEEERLTVSLPGSTSTGGRRLGGGGEGRRERERNTSG